ncbi:MAG: hypothetical protein ACREOE_09995, partial [Gemmatimonadales bacterium]
PELDPLELALPASELPPSELAVPESPRVPLDAPPEPPPDDSGAPLLLPGNAPLLNPLPLLDVPTTGPLSSPVSPLLQ